MSATKLPFLPLFLPPSAPALLLCLLLSPLCPSPFNLLALSPHNDAVSRVLQCSHVNSLAVQLCSLQVQSSSGWSDTAMKGYKKRHAQQQKSCRLNNSQHPRPPHPPTFKLHNLNISRATITVSVLLTHPVCTHRLQALISATTEAR